MDIKEIKNDISSTFSERLKNPFILSFILSWLVWNWLIVYEILTFPNSFTMWNKVEIINRYIQNEMAHITILPLVSSLFVAVIYIIFSSAFLLLFNWFNTTLKSQIFLMTAKGENIPRKLYDSINTKYNKLKLDFDNSRIHWNQIEQDNSKHIDEIYNNKLADSKQKDEIITLQRELKISTQSYDTLQSRVNELEFFIKSEYEKFTQAFMNKKTWYLYIKKSLEHREYEQIDTIRFEENGLVKDVATGNIKYELKEVTFSRDKKIIRFELIDYHDANFMHFFYISYTEGSTYQGLLINGSINNKPKSILLTQDKEKINDVDSIL